MYLTEWLMRRYKNQQVGNYIFWLSFCIVGQPAAIMMYYHDWVVANQPTWIAEAVANSHSDMAGKISAVTPVNGAVCGVSPGPPY